LLLEAGALAAEAGPVLYVTGEESAAQVRCALTGSAPSASSFSSRPRPIWPPCSGTLMRSARAC